MTADRAATEVLGYVLVIALVTTTIAVGMTVGLDGIQNAQDSEQTANMERAFEVLGDNLESVKSGEAPSRSTEFRIHDGEIHYGDPTTIEIRSGPDDESTLEHVVTQPIIWKGPDGTRIAYEGGAIIREEDHGSRMVEPPSFVLDEHQTLIQAVRTRPQSDSHRSVSGPRTALVGGDSLRINVSTTSDVPVNVTITSPRADAWRSYFEDEAPDGASIDGNETTATYSPPTGDIEDHETAVVRYRIRMILRS